MASGALADCMRGRADLCNDACRGYDARDGWAYGCRGRGVHEPASFLESADGGDGGTAAAAGIALINAVGNTAGFVGPYLVGWISDETKSTSVEMYVLASLLLLGSALTFLVPAALVNRRRE